MATPFMSMLRAKQNCFGSFSLYRRCFTSKRKKGQQIGQAEKVHVKSLFEARRVGGKSEKGRKLVKNYRTMLDHRHEQASRSVLIRVPMHPQGVCDTLQALGPINKAFSLHRVKNYLLVEFKHKETVEKLMQHVSYFPDASQIPIRSRLLYAMQNVQVQRHRPGNSFVPETIASKELTSEDYMAAESVTHQMEVLHDVRQLSDVGSRLRFLVCSLVEDLVKTSMPFCRIEPFGSSSNGFGWEGCDLDMVMSLRPPQSQINSNTRFRFLTKRGSEEERVFGQQCLDVVGEMVRGLMPSTHSVNKVLNARVPIIKFYHEATELDCDLAHINVSGSKMSELMYLLGELDPRARILMTTVKQWAKLCDLTRSHPGPWPSSFTLLTMVIFFLQTRSPPLLPSLRYLQELAGPDDHFIIDDVDYAFVTDVSKVVRSTNTQSLDELLKEFFHFFSHFNFADQGLSLIEGSTFARQTSSPMHIENPLDIGHNVSNTVSPVFVTRLQEAMIQAVQCLESHSIPDGANPWGLLCLFQPVSQSQASKVYSVASLFEGDGENGEGEFGSDKTGDHDAERGGEPENVGLSGKLDDTASQNQNRVELAAQTENVEHSTELKEVENLRLDQDVGLHGEPGCKDSESQTSKKTVVSVETESSKVVEIEGPKTGSQKGSVVSS